MEALSKALVCLAAITLVMAVAGVAFTVTYFGVIPEALSRASNNLAILAIAIAVVFGGNKLGS